LKISVVTAAYNATWCIERGLESALAQTRPPDEIIVCDDGSTDGTPDLVEKRFGSAVTVLRLPHRNASATRKVGLDQARGDWLAFLDADDYWAPEKLERQIDFIARHPEIRLLTTDGVYVSAEGVIRDSWLADYFDPVQDLTGDLAPLLIQRCFTLVSSILVERNVYHEVGGINPEIQRSYDYDLWLRVLARHPGGLMKDRLISYWSSPGALSRNYEANSRDDLDLMRRIERGALGPRADLPRLAARRAAAIEFGLGLNCMRSGRTREGRERMWRATQFAPLRRRLVAAAASITPDWALPFLMRSSWLKGAVSSSRAPAARIPIDDASERAA
jgi:glycosyltransferase involved in cell wall biosynthesis